MNAVLVATIAALQCELEKLTEVGKHLDERYELARLESQKCDHAIEQVKDTLKELHSLQQLYANEGRP